MNQRETDYISKVQNNTRQLWNSINNLKDLQRQWNALDYGNTLGNETIPSANVGAVVFDTANALDTLLGQGHATNLAKLL